MKVGSSSNGDGNLKKTAVSRLRAIRQEMENFLLDKAYEVEADRMPNILKFIHRK